MPAGAGPARRVSGPGPVLARARPPAAGGGRSRDRRVGEPPRSAGGVGALSPAARGLSPLRARRRWSTSRAGSARTTRSASNEIWSYHAIGDQVRFTLVHRSREQAPKAARAAKARTAEAGEGQGAQVAPQADRACTRHAETRPESRAPGAPQVGVGGPPISSRQARLRALLPGRARRRAAAGRRPPAVLVPHAAQRQAGAAAVRRRDAARDRSAVSRRALRLAAHPGHADSVGRGRDVARTPPRRARRRKIAAPREDGRQRSKQRRRTRAET